MDEVLIGPFLYRKEKPVARQVKALKMCRGSLEPVCTGEITWPQYLHAIGLWNPTMLTFPELICLIHRMSVDWSRRRWWCIFYAWSIIGNGFGLKCLPKRNRINWGPRTTCNFLWIIIKYFWTQIVLSIHWCWHLLNKSYLCAGYITMNTTVA